MRDRPLCGICLILALLICTTAYVGKGPAAKNLRPSPLKQAVSEDEVLILEGQVYRKEIKENYQILFLKNNSINYQEQSFIEPKIIVYDEDKKEVRIGNKVRVTGAVSYYEGARNPGNFDQKLYYQKLGIQGSVWALQVEMTDRKVHWILDRLYMLRQGWKNVLCEAVGEKDGSTLSAMILGDKTGMDADTKELYQANGIGHIMAIILT